MSIADKAQAHALLVDGQDVPTPATPTVRDPATGEPAAELADATPPTPMHALEEYAAVAHVVFELPARPARSGATLSRRPNDD